MALVIGLLEAHAIMCRLNLFVLYNAWPDKHGPETWEQRFLWLGRYVLCQCGEPEPLHAWGKELQVLCKGTTEALI